MGSRVTRAGAHLPAEEVKRRRHHDPHFWCRQRWLIIYQALIAPRKAQEIALHSGGSLSTVRRVISTYTRLGTAAVETPGTGGRRHEYLTAEQERALLQPFFTRAAAGEIATAAEIQRAFEAQVQHPVHPSTIFRLLNRHAWRKLVPRPVHPKADPAAQAAFKKTLRRRSRLLSPRAPQTIIDRC